MKYKVVPKKERGKILYYYIKVKSRFLFIPIWVTYREFVDEDDEFSYKMQVKQFKNCTEAGNYLREVGVKHGEVMYYDPIW